MKKYPPIGLQLYKPLRLKIIGPWIVELDRSEQITKIQADPNTKLHDVEYRHENFTPEQWLKRANEFFRGQPIWTAEENLVEFLQVLL